MTKIKNGRLVLKNVRMVYPHLYKNEMYKNEDTGKRAATFLISKSDKNAIKIIKEEIKRVISESNVTGKVPSEKNCFKDGDDHDTEGYHDNYYIKAGNTKIQVFDSECDEADALNNEFHNGCHVDASISLWAHKGEHGKRVGANLHAVRFVKEGDEFGNFIDAREDFDDDDDEDDDDLQELPVKKKRKKSKSKKVEQEDFDDDDDDDGDEDEDF